MKIIVYIILSIVAFVCYVRYLERTSLFHPEKDVLSSPSDIGLAFEDVHFLSGGKYNLHGWFIPTGKDNASTLLFIHGNAGNIGDRLGKISYFHDMGLNIFIFDYRGYGHSEGQPTEQGMYDDALAAYDEIVKRRAVNPNKIIVYGASLGGAAAIDLASQKDISLLIVDSVFTNAVDMAQNIYPFVPAFLINIKLDSASKIRKVKVPKLFLHSKEDEIVPFALGWKLFEYADEPKDFIELIGDHNDGHINDKGKFVNGIKKFIDKYEKLS